MSSANLYGSAYVAINTEKVREAIRSQELKRYWVAEMAGVHKTTLRRWLSGQITKVREENAINLAHVLTLPIDRVVKANSRVHSVS